MRYVMSLTWNTPWSMPPSLKSAAMVKVQKGASEPGHKLKEFKRIAMRACKTDMNFQEMICLAATFINSR